MGMLRYGLKTGTLDYFHQGNNREIIPSLRENRQLTPKKSLFDERTTQLVIFFLQNSDFITITC